MDWWIDVKKILFPINPSKSHGALQDTVGRKSIRTGGWEKELQKAVFLIR